MIQQIQLPQFVRIACVMGLLSVLLVPSSGCRICADCEDLAYPAYGGAWQRTRRDEGRVGSLFDPAGAKVSELVQRDQPLDESELQRRRQEERGGMMLEPDDIMEPQENDESDSDDRQQRRQQLEDRSLEDIQPENQGELERKRLEDIEINVLPGETASPIL